MSVEVAKSLSGPVLETEVVELAPVDETWLVDGVEPAEIQPGDPDALQKLQDATKAFRALETRRYADLYKQCQLLLTIRMLKLFKAANYRSFVEFAEKELGLQGRRAEKMSEYARHFTQEQFVLIGPSLAEAGLQLLDATPEPDGPADLFTMTLKFGPGAGKSFVNASVRQVQAEIQGFRSGEAPLPHVVPTGLEETTKELAERVKGARFKLKNFKSKDAVTTGLVIELPDASHEALQSMVARILGVLSKPKSE